VERSGQAWLDKARLFKKHVRRTRITHSQTPIDYTDIYDASVCEN
jgi:hypothetical protein